MYFFELIMLSLGKKREYAMKRFFIVFITLLVGCSNLETVQEPLQQLETINEVQQENEYKNAYSLTKVRTSQITNLVKGKTIDQLLEEVYMKKVYGEIYELHNEQQLIEFIGQKILEKDAVVGSNI